MTTDINTNTTLSADLLAHVRATAQAISAQPQTAA